MFYCILDVLCYVCIVHILWKFCVYKQEQDAGSGKKRKHIHETLREKSQAPKEIEKRLSR